MSGVLQSNSSYKMKCLKLLRLSQHAVFDMQLTVAARGQASVMGHNE
jgi:hypothetical protein